MTLKDSTEHIQGCLMTYDGACDGNMESHDGVVRLCRMRIWSDRYDSTTWAKESMGQSNEHNSFVIWDH